MVEQFEIYWIDLDPTKGSEINKKRPCVVLSPKEMNDNLNTIIVAPLTSTIRNYPTRVDVTIDKKKGQIALDHIRSIDKSRIDNKITMLNQKTIEKVKIVLLKMFK
tara:strand:- start:1056 stop:1373 length:318 start_codon:yes stop_codon:yes gene_type:complete